MVDKKQFKVEDGALVEVPIYETHSRGRNWLAIIESDPQAPNGLKRQFVTNGKEHPEKYMTYEHGYIIIQPIE